MKKVDTSVTDKYSKIIRENDLSTNSAYPEIEIIRELGNIKELKNKEEVEEKAEEQELGNIFVTNRC